MESKPAEELPAEPSEALKLRPVNRVEDVAKALHVPPTTVRDWISDGFLASLRAGPQKGALILIEASAVHACLEKMREFGKLRGGG